ncbi:conserved exported hypothetical protein [Bradyrhizobium sp. ORS 375]|uniref:hypothetical protein n=1 Tax=Bradyrhizobium sp. (strain ORS 375) TaxID=566679 RepID=UPI0002408648|nr:hypothetical protein [Bradyrhizobium sp. ORS 375]CCD96499.1 conserved exported hypothetical protein [Bradyrhizobium sp. ORS 375]
MLRFKVLVSAVPLIAAAVFAKLELAPSPQPCIAVGADSVALGAAPFRADLHVEFTDDPALATVRVALAENPETADLVVVDDAPAKEGEGCGLSAARQVVAIAADPRPGSPLIYLVRDDASDGPADYRIYVRSSRVTAEEAAALIVAAHRHADASANPVL